MDKKSGTKTSASYARSFLAVLCGGRKRDTIVAGAVAGICGFLLGVWSGKSESTIHICSDCPELRQQYIESLEGLLNVYVEKMNRLDDRLDRMESRMIRAGMIGPLPAPNGTVKIDTK